MADSSSSSGLTARAGPGETKPSGAVQLIGDDTALAEALLTSRRTATAACKEDPEEDADLKAALLLSLAPSAQSACAAGTAASSQVVDQPPQLLVDSDSDGELELVGSSVSSEK